MSVDGPDDCDYDPGFDFDLYISYEDQVVCESEALCQALQEGEAPSGKKYGYKDEKDAVAVLHMLLMPYSTTTQMVKDAGGMEEWGFTVDAAVKAAVLKAVEEGVNSKDAAFAAWYVK